MSVDDDVSEPPATEPLADSAMEFRAVQSGGKRRGIRLEPAFWQAVKSIAKERGMTVGAFVNAVATQSGDSANLTSAIRVACLKAYADRSENLQLLGAAETVEAVIAANPSPAFTLAANRRIMSFNAGFQALVRRQFAGGGDSARTELRLSLDVAVEDLIARLLENGNTPVSTGFVIAMSEKRHRGQVNVIRVPSKNSDLLMAFVAG